jgi:hypothetical protein
MPLLGAPGRALTAPTLKSTSPAVEPNERIGPDLKMGFHKWRHASVAFRSGWYCGYCIAASAVLVFGGFRYVAAAAIVVRERTRRLENKRAFGEDLCR